MLDLPECVWLTVPLPDGLRWAAAGLGMLALLGQIRVHRALLVCRSAARRTRDGRVLIATGPFRRVRHPLYAVLLVFFASLALFSAFWPFWVLAAPLLPLFIRTAIREETALIERFGDDYRDYRRRTGLFFPRLRPMRAL